MKNILVVLTCFNRKEKTEKCIRSVVSTNSQCIFTFIVADDKSSDGTLEVLQKMKLDYNIIVLEGDGTLFYSGGMHMAMNYALNKLVSKYDYLLMINDDVEFLFGSIEKMIKQSYSQNDAVIVGAMKDDTGVLSYGAVKYIRGIRYRKMNLDEWNDCADTFNANCVLIPYSVFEKTGAMDEYYRHSLGDFDYGLALKRNGYKIYTSKEFVGICNNNLQKGTWTDSTLSIKERIKRKESIKGAPVRQWFYFLKKNFGLFVAIKSSITPYIRIIIGK